MVKLSKINLDTLEGLGFNSITKKKNPKAAMFTLTNKFIEELERRKLALNTQVCALRDLRSHMKDLKMSQKLIDQTKRPDMTTKRNAINEAKLAENNKTPLSIHPDFNNYLDFVSTIGVLCDEEENPFLNPQICWEAIAYLQVATCSRLNELKTLSFEADDEGVVYVRGALKQRGDDVEMPFISGAPIDDVVTLWVRWQKLTPEHQSKLLSPNKYPQKVKEYYGVTTHALRKYGAHLAARALGRSTSLNNYMLLAQALRHKVKRIPVTLANYGNVEE